MIYSTVLIFKKSRELQRQTLLVSSLLAINTEWKQNSMVKKLTFILRNKLIYFFWYVCVYMVYIVAYTCVLYAHMCAYVDICACMQDAEEDAMHLLYYFVPYSFNSYYICAGNQA